MAIRNSKPIVWRPVGLSDTIDATNTFRGAMQVLSNLVPASDTDGVFVCRPASTQLTDFEDLTTPGFVSALLIVGDIAYGMISSALHAGKDQPFAYNIKTNAHLTITGIKAANVPTSPATSGDWTPPAMAVVGTRILVIHPGFAGGAVKFGWFDISSFSSNTITGNTNTSTTIDTLSVDVLQAGWQPGMAISDSAGDIPAGTTIVSIASDGLSCVISAAATASTAGTIFTVTGGTPVSPQWAAGDTNLNNLPSVPVDVGQMNGRAWYLCGKFAVYSDSLLPCNVTNASQALDFGNGLNCTAIGPLGLATLTGGVVQSLIVFQGVSAMQQITGDPATTNLATNTLPVATGTLSPLSVTPINQGLAFMSPEGMRIVNLAAEVSDPIGDHGTGVTVPFIFALYPSRVVATSNADVLRISVQNSNVAGNPYQEYWYDLTRKVWTGPHTFPASLIQPWTNTFVLTPIGVTGTLWQSDAIPNNSSAFTENGTALGWQYSTPLLPDNQNMSMNAMVETTIFLALPPSALTSSAVALFLDEDGNILGQVPIAVNTGSPVIWGTAVWGMFVWGAGASPPAQHQIKWISPIVFKQGFLSITGSSALNVHIGNLYMRYQILNYLIENP